MLRLQNFVKQSSGIGGFFSARGFSTTQTFFAGHSKWQNIRHDKAKNDAKRSKHATTIATRIEATVKQNGALSNAQLEMLLDQAKNLNITKKIIENAIKRGLGEIEFDGPVKQEVLYEFIGPGGIAFIVLANTDNKARTVAYVKAAMTKINASLSPIGYLFNKKGEIIVDSSLSLDEMLDVAIEIGADDVEHFEDLDSDYNSDSLFKFITDPDQVHEIANNVSSQGLKLKDVKTSFIPDDLVELHESLEEKHLTKCLAELDAVPELVDYYTNLK